MNPLTEQEMLGRNVGEVIDRFLTVQICTAGGPSVFAQRPLMDVLYGAARRVAGDEPLTYGAARRLLDVLGEGDRVVVTTGFIVPPYMRLETDGPLGAAVLGRALALGRGVNPVIVTEAEGVEPLEAVMAASGLQLANGLEEARDVPHKAAVLPFPVDLAAARREARRLLDQVNPRAVIAIEKPSRNRDGRYHNGMGVDISGVSAKVDVLFDEARERGVLTIGIGDGGNEIGMGNIEETIRAHVPRGEKVAAATEVDHLVVASSSNLGAYGVAACAAAMLGRPELLHSEEREARLQEAAARAGLVDPYTGLAEGWVDGIPPEVTRAAVRILEYAVRARLDAWFLEAYRRWGTREDVHRRLLEQHRRRWAAGAAGEEEGRAWVAQV